MQDKSPKYLRVREEGTAFRARGSRVIRCQLCLLPEVVCICQFRKLCSSKVTFWLLMHRKEQYKPTNTGRLILDTIANSRVSIWHRTEPPAELIFALKNSKIKYMVLYPTDEQTDINPRQMDLSQIDQEICIIIPDGTWRQASKIMRNSAYLDHLPRIGLWNTQPSDYQLRKSQETYQLCTAEVAIALLDSFKLDNPAKQLKAYYDIFNVNYGAARRGKRLESKLGDD